MQSLLTTAQVAAKLGITQRRVQALVAAGRLKAVEVTPRFFLISAASLAAFRARGPGRPRKDMNAKGLTTREKSRQNSRI